MKKETGTEGMAKVKGLEVCKGGWVYRGVCVFREGVWRERETDGGILKFRVLRKRERRGTKYEQDRSYIYPRSVQKVMCFFKKKKVI